MQTITTKGFKETQLAAEEFAHTLKDEGIICLYGDLGYGKTTFVQGLSKGLGITGKILSPTFIIMRSYRFRMPDSRFKSFYHVDLYRIGSEQEIIDLGLIELMQDPENIIVIEWPEKMGKLLPEKRINIQLEYIDENKRNIIITR